MGLGQLVGLQVGSEHFDAAMWTLLLLYAACVVALIAISVVWQRRPRQNALIMTAMNAVLLVGICLVLNAPAWALVVALPAVVISTHSIGVIFEARVREVEGRIGEREEPSRSV